MHQVADVGHRPVRPVRLRRTVLPFVLAAFLAALIACGGPPSGGGGETVRWDEARWDEARWTP